MSAAWSEAEAARLLRRLAGSGARLVADDDGWRLETPQRRAGRRGRDPSIPTAMVDELLARGLIAAGDDAALSLSGEGQAFLRRQLSGADGFSAQHQTRGKAVVEIDDAVRAPVTVNQDESPLAWLRRHRGRDGKPLVDAAEFAAGERLRADYERGSLMPRVTANWTAAVADGRRTGGAGGRAELTEAALSARIRVDKALAAVGPEFGDLLVDFCCFLKGIEEIERGRQWPARSAKLVLRLALASLARHYGLVAEGRGRDGGARLRHWGTEDFRPAIE